MRTRATALNMIATIICETIQQAAHAACCQPREDACSHARIRFCRLRPYRTRLFVMRPRNNHRRRVNLQNTLRLVCKMPARYRGGGQGSGLYCYHLYSWPPELCFWHDQGCGLLLAEQPPRFRRRTCPGHHPHMSRKARACSIRFRSRLACKVPVVKIFQGRLAILIFQYYV